MSKRLLATIVVCAAVTTLVIGAVGCGSGTGATTTTVQPTSTTAAMATSTTTSAPATTSIPGTTASSTASSPELLQYVAALTAWGTAFDTAPETTFLKITDPSAATAADLTQADAASAFIHKVQDQLLAIKPPAQLATLHNKVVSAFQAEVKTMDEFISALKSKDAAKMKSAADTLNQQGSALTDLVNQLMAGAGGQ